jgi:hypothetical protein
LQRPIRHGQEQTTQSPSKACPSSGAVRHTVEHTGLAANILAKCIWSCKLRTVCGYNCIGVKTYPSRMSYYHGYKGSLWQLKVDRDNSSARGDAIPQAGRRSEPARLAGTEDSDNTHHLSLAHTPNSGYSRFHAIAAGSGPISDGKFTKQECLSNEANSTAKNGECCLCVRTGDARWHENVDILAPFARESTFIDNLIAEYALLSHSTIGPSLTHTRYERLRAGPVVPNLPKGDLLQSRQQQGNIPTKAANESKQRSRNFRGLRLHTQHSTPSTELDQDSPDWVCQTSLAIEAAAISAHTNRRDPTPRHILEAMRSSVQSHSSNRKRVQSFGPGVKETIYSASSSKHEWICSVSNRHSEDALQLVRRETSLRPAGEAEKVKAASEVQRFKYGDFRKASSMNLDKRLPALPRQ